MKTMDFLSARMDETRDIIEIVKTEFEPLNSSVFNSSPAPGKWSVAECIQHLNLTLQIYIPQMQETVKIKNKYPGQKANFKHSLLGRLAVKSMAPKQDNKIPMKMKTFKMLTPDNNELNKQQVLDLFLEFQKDCLTVIEGLEHMSLEKPKIITAAGPMLKMRLGDALHFMVAHNQRHILQAQNVLKIIG